MLNWELHEMDCRLAMAMLMDANSVDSIVCDPPYGLSKEPDMAEVLTHWLNGDDYEHGGSGFMGKSWDSFVPGPSVWREAYRVLKPGGHLIAFFGTRTYDLGVLALRLAGFEVRDQLAWVFGSGFPKSHDVSKGIDKRGGANIGWFGPWLRVERAKRGLTQKSLAIHFPSKTGGLTGCVANWELGLNTPTVEQFNLLCRILELPFKEIHEAEREVIGSIAGGKLAVAPGQENDRSARTLDITGPATPEAAQWQGWGTALKPAYEPIVLCRKPLSEPTVAANVLRWGTGALNIDGTRIGGERRLNPAAANKAGGNSLNMSAIGMPQDVAAREAVGRWPANLAHDGSDEVLAEFPVNGPSKATRGLARAATAGCLGEFAGQDDVTMGHDDQGGSAARYFYCAKASKSDRNEGLDDLREQTDSAHRKTNLEETGDNPYLRGLTARRNTHPTVKPTALMQWLVRMVTPPGGLVLDPFTGSGSTGKAAVREGFSFVGCEMTADYLEIARLRIDHAVNNR